MRSVRFSPHNRSFAVNSGNPKSGQSIGIIAPYGTTRIAASAFVDQCESEMLHTRNLAGLVEIDGLSYEWAVQREPQWCTADGWRGMVVSVRQVDQRRQALLEFPMPKSGNGSQYRRRPQINDTIAANGVRAALAAGWDATSRGKAETYMVDANGC